MAAILGGNMRPLPEVAGRLLVDARSASRMIAGVKYLSRVS